MTPTLSPGAVFNPHRAFHGVWIPQWLEERHEVSEKAKKAYAYLTFFAGSKGQAWPSYNTLAKKLHVSRRHVIRILHELTVHRLIRITHIKDSIRGNQANIYEFLWHEWMQHSEDAHFKLVVPDEPPLENPSTRNVTRVTQSPLPPPSDISDTIPGDVPSTTPSDIGVTPLVTPLSPKENNKKRINYKRIKVGRYPGAETASQPDQPTNHPSENRCISHEQWLKTLKQGHSDKDIEGELKSFLAHCNGKGTTANRSGFLGWLKIASPAIRPPKPKPRYTY
ncbi:MAG: hypothetical protein C5B47_07980 [Verrucomicrobia bacterium]|nr:MAG: hypothetical protein C5B47_07980 [Verrucomicrobiota bacterium]